jgi:hypothetical protein
MTALSGTGASEAFQYCSKGREKRSFKTLNITGLQKAYPEFEFTCLRHAVSTAEIFCYLVREIRMKGRIFATFATQTGPEKVT